MKRAGRMIFRKGQDPERNLKILTLFIRNTTAMIGVRGRSHGNPTLDYRALGKTKEVKSDNTRS